jgi:hypothetical protein
MRTRDSYVRERRAQEVGRGNTLSEPVAQSLLRELNSFAALLEQSAMFHLLVSLVAGYMGLITNSDFLATIVIATGAGCSLRGLYLARIQGLIE